MSLLAWYGVGSENWMALGGRYTGFACSTSYEGFEGVIAK
jgi:hypothetical protein